MDIKTLTKNIIEFREQRNWKQFHTIKDLCLGIGIEVSELQALFLWKSIKEIEVLKIQKKEAIEDELADIFIFIIYLCKEFEVDINKAVINKLAKNNLKYPIDKSYNSNKKHNEL